MQLKTENEIVKLYFKDRLVFTHTEKKPFVCAVLWDLEYKSTHGTFKVKAKTKEVLPLAKVAVCDAKEDNIVLQFSRSGYKLIASFCEKNGMLCCTLQASRDGAYRFAFPSEAKEAFFGGGEQYRQLNLKGERVINFVSEHIKVKPILQKTLFRFLPYKEKKHKDIVTYSPMSTFVSSKKYAVRFDLDGYGEADFRQDGVSVFTYEKCPRKFVYACGQSFAEISRTLNQDTPNREYLPNWAYDGMILGVQGGIDRVEQKAEEMRKSGAAVCGVWCQDWSGKKVTAVGSQVYWNWSADETRYPDLRNRIAALKEKGVRFLAYINPYLVKDGPMYNECKEKGYLIKNTKGEIYHIKSTTFDAGMFDLTNPKTVEYLKETVIKRNMLDLGIDGYMADFGEYLPTDSVLFAGDAKELHNSWPTMWARINRDAVDSHARAKEIFFFTRSGYNGAQNETTMMWNGDQHTDFTKDYGMGCVMPATFNLGFSGMTAVHSDIGGFISFSSLARDYELFLRWMEMNVFSPLLRSHETIRPEKNAQPYDAEILSDIAKLSHLHRALKPYIMECMKEANEGIPVMTPDFYYQDDFGKHKDLYSFMLGEEIFVAPVIERGARARKVFLPQGDWIKFFDDKIYGGGKAYEVDAPLGVPVAFYRKGGKYESIFSKISL